MHLCLTVLMYMLTQAVLFGIGTITILTTPLAHSAETLMPIMIGVSMIAAAPIAWAIAIMMRLNIPRASHLWRHVRHPQH